MIPLNVFIEIEGKQTKVGEISGNNYIDASFKYDSKYLSSESSTPISISLPLQETSFSAETTKCYFEALLPEGFSRKAVANWARVDENDYISLLAQLGKECIGAVQITSEERMTEGGYTPIDNEELLSLAKEGASKSTELLMESHISLAGASGKVGLFLDENSHKWYKPYGIAASTHIVKQSHVRLENLVLNEQLCMRTAAKLNIEVPDSFIINAYDGKNQSVLYATKRYDRININKEDELCSPLRLHQEDFGQALGIFSSDKYETKDRKYIKKIFELINNYSSNPLEDGLKLWNRLVFNYFIGNTDAHIKNYGLLYSSDLKSIRLAPSYDIVCTRIYGNRNDMSIMIDSELDCTKLSRSSFAAAARSVAIGEKLALKQVDFIRDNLDEALFESAKELTESGFTDAKELRDKILFKNEELLLRM